MFIKLCLNYDKYTLCVSIILTFLEMKPWRLESIFLGNCMDKLLLNAYENVYEWGTDLANKATAREFVAGSTGLESVAP